MMDAIRLNLRARLAPLAARDPEASPRSGERMWLCAPEFRAIRDLHRAFLDAGVRPSPCAGEEAARHAAFYALDGIVHMLDRTEAGERCRSEVRIQSIEPGRIVMQIAIESLEVGS
jgi:hypothetical protein